LDDIDLLSIIDESSFTDLRPDIAVRRHSTTQYIVVSMLPQEGGQRKSSFCSPDRFGSRLRATGWQILQVIRPEAVPVHGHSGALLKAPAPRWI
jgi:hypothetical protein